MGLLDQAFEDAPGHFEFATQVEVALGSSHGLGRDGHAFEHQVRAAQHALAILESSGLTLVSIQDDVAFGDGLVADALPLNVRRKTRAAAPLQASGFDGRNDTLRTELRGPGEGATERLGPGAQVDCQVSVRGTLGTDRSAPFGVPGGGAGFQTLPVPLGCIHIVDADLGQRAPITQDGRRQIAAGEA